MKRAPDADRASFDRLLAALDPDRERAGALYEGLRARLIRFFAWRGAEGAEDLADRTIDRVSRKFSEGETIREADPSAYFYGVARNILRERWTERARERSRQPLVPFPPAPAPEERAVFERRLACLDRCLAALPARSRELVLAYYEGRRRVRIDARRALAEARGIPVNALRIRVCRLRLHLEACVRACLDVSSDETNPAAGHSGEER